MIGVHEDTDTDGDADASDKWYYPAYDEAWRMVANFRESDSSPKEEWVNHLAGDDGYGGSSYINGVVLRDKDANTDWTSASDGTLEQRVYLCQNWRGDMSALVKTGKLLLEWDKYSAYGIPFGLPGADTDSDGDCDGSGAGTDIAAIQALIDAPGYSVRADVDLDGDVDSTDKTTAQEQLLALALAWNSLSRQGNRFSYAGHQRFTPLSIDAVRHRILSPALGYWQQRDSLLYVDGLNLYVFCGGTPVSQRDPFGLLAGFTETEGCVLETPECTALKKLAQKQKPNAEILGATGCRNGKAFSCVYAPEEPGRFSPIEQTCLKEHEKVHEGQADCPQPGSGKVESPLKSLNTPAMESPAYYRELDCWEREKANCQGSKPCEDAVNAAENSACFELQVTNGNMMQHPACANRGANNGKWVNSGGPVNKPPRAR